MNYRSVLETFKFSAPKDVVQQFNIVNNSWQQVGSSNELWWEFCQDRMVGAEYLSAFKTPFEAFKNLKATHFLVFMSQAYGKLCWYDCAKKVCANGIDFFRHDMFHPNSQSVLLGDMSLIVCGGGDTPSFKVFKITEKGVVQELPRLGTSRLNFGLVHFKGKLYVFGGETAREELNSSESLILTARRWFFAGNMIASRSSFNPCGYGNNIFLCGGNTDQCERYDSCERDFFQLPITLREKGPACAFMFGEQIIILQTNKAYRVDAESLQLLKEINKSHLESYFTMRPVIVGNTYFTLKDNISNVKVHELSSHIYIGTCTVQNVERVTMTYDQHFNIVKVVKPITFDSS